ncbi:uncharacterized protein [Argopecten irradians]|uniref:uncharacterized protein n=1 Tax=Argopecten irradians TaxID=31199 RepID=UPI0037229ACF
MTTLVRMSTESDVFYKEMTSGIHVMCCPKTLCWTERNCDVISALKKEGLVPKIVKSPKDVSRMTSQLVLNSLAVVVVCDHNENILKSAAGGITQDQLRNIILVTSRPDTQGELKQFDIVVLPDALDKQHLVGLIKIKSSEQAPYTNNFFTPDQQRKQRIHSANETEDETALIRSYSRTISDISVLEEQCESQCQTPGVNFPNSMQMHNVISDKDNAEEDIFSSSTQTAAVRKRVSAGCSYGISSWWYHSGPTEEYIILVTSRPDTQGELKQFDIVVLPDALDKQHLVGLIKIKSSEQAPYTNNFFTPDQQRKQRIHSANETEDETALIRSYSRTISDISVLEEQCESQCQTPGVNFPNSMQMHNVISDKDNAEEDIFINTNSGCPEEGLRGVFVRQSTYTVQETQDEAFPLFLARFLSADDGERQRLTRVINALWIPQFKEKQDFVSLTQLIKGGDSRLQRELTEVIFEIQLNFKYRSRSIESLLLGVNTFFDIVCQTDYTDTKEIEKYTPIFLNNVSILLICLAWRESDSDTIQHVLTKCGHALSTASGVRGKGHTAANCMYPITEVLTCFVHQLRSNSKLQKAKYKDALFNQKLHKYIPKMSFLDLYTLFLDILQRLKRKSMNEDLQTLRYMVSCLLDKHNKQAKTEPLTTAILMCVTQGIVNIIKDTYARNDLGSSDDLDIMELLCVMDLYFDSRKFGQVIRTTLLREAECLLFLKDIDLVQKVWYWHNISGMQSQQLQNKTIEYIEQLLQPLHFQILRADFVPSNAFSPAWCTLHGTSIVHRSVTLHCLLPSLQCLLDGTMSDYKLKANKEDTKYEINTLEILRIIQAERNHPGILSLHAYQCRPIPLFFVVDRFKGADLFSYLHQRRKDKNWINLSALAKISSEVVSAVDFLHSKKVIHRNITASSFALDSRKRLILTDFSIAKHVDASEVSVSDLEGTGLPTRWTAPESLLEGRFDVRTDTWMIGQLLYEIYTHGCQPFVELYTIATEKVMEWVVFQKLTPKQWPCIPRNVHDMILRCVHIEADERVDLKSAKNVFLSYRNSPTTAQPRLPVSRACDEDKMYPDLPANQKEPMEVERGIPKLFLDLRKGKKGPRNSYTYWNESRRQRTMSSHLEVTQQDLLAPDQPRYSSKGNFLEVNEPVTQAFVENVYPLLTGYVMKWFHIRHWPVVVQNYPSTGVMDFNCTLVYGCDQGENILEFALANRLGSPSVPENMTKYYRILQSLARLISGMHAKDFILRDLCASNVFFCESSGKVFLPRLGRILHLGSNCTLDDSTLSEKPPNRNRWMPIEVLQSAQYSKQSDMYMFAMTLYEFFMALDSLTRNPNTNILKTVPFATVKTNLLLEHLYRGQIPQRPLLCPVWLYEIMQNCWDRDRTRRPNIDDVESMLQERLSQRILDVDPGYDKLHQPPKHKTAIPSSIYRIGRVPRYCNQIANQMSSTLSVVPTEISESVEVHVEVDSDYSCDKNCHDTSCLCSDCDSIKSDLSGVSVPLRPDVGRRREIVNSMSSRYDKIPHTLSTAISTQSRNDPQSMYESIAGLTDTEIQLMKRETERRKRSTQTLPIQRNRNLNKKMPTPVEQMISIPVPKRSATLPAKITLVSDPCKTSSV